MSSRIARGDLLGWIWGGECVTAAWGHVDKAAFVTAVAEIHGVSEEEVGEPQHLYVLRDPANDGNGCADEAWKQVEATDEGAKAITMEVV